MSPIEIHSVHHPAWRRQPTRDGRPGDYAFWDRLRRGQASGYELSGVFMKAVSGKIAASTLGEAPDITSADAHTTQHLSAWLDAQWPAILQAYQEALDLGDAYLLLKPDGALELVPPHVVEPLLDEVDFSQRRGWTVTDTYRHPHQPGEVLTVRDAYTAHERIRERWRNGVHAGTERYPNPLGRVPLVHIANRRRGDAVYGTPEGAALLDVLARYNEVLNHAIDGNKRQGHPTPTFSKLGSAAEVQQLFELMGRQEERTRADGRTENVTVIDFDADQVVALSGEGEFRYEAPGSFSQDSTTLLKYLFYLLVQHTEIPEFVFGVAIASSKASAQAQMEPYQRMIAGRRGACGAWLRELCQLAAAYLALSDAAIRPDERWRLTWPD